MSSTSANSSNILTRKCGEIIITIKKKKNIYSFSCCFCDTICLQMKKFTLHLEQEHVTQLEQSEEGKDCKTDIQSVPSVDNILLGEIKIEDCSNDGIKSEIGEDNSKVVTIYDKKEEFHKKFQDPLETFGENINEISVPLRQEYNKTSALKLHHDIYHNNDNGDMEMHDFSDEHHEDYSDFSGDDYISETDFKKEKKPSTKGNAKVQENEFTLALIEEYQANPQLWNTTLAARCNLQQKENLLQVITDNMNAKLKMELKAQMVKKKLNFVCKQYEKEIERQLNENVTNSDLWFYDNMSFLKDITENKLKLKKRKPKLNVKPLSDNIFCDLLDIYKNYNNLWDVNHLAYTVKEKRHEIMQSMLGEIKNKMNISLDIHRLEKHLNYIHKSFAKDKQLRFECEVKQQDFQPSCSYFHKCDFLEAHQGPFKCSNCKDIIETYNDYQIHKSQHDGTMPFKCQECGMGFKRISNYTIHAKRHLRVFKFHCEICGKGYPFNAELDLHMRSHTGAQPYLCSVCGEGFRTAISYDNHIRRHEERFKYFCHICKKGFNHMTRLNDHIKAHLNVRDVICTVCGKGFTSRKYLNHHKRIHEGKNYSCNICGKSFAQDAGLRAHKKYHGTPIGVSVIQKKDKRKL